MTIPGIACLRGGRGRGERICPWTNEVWTQKTSVLAQDEEPSSRRCVVLPPLLVILFGLVGFSALTPYLDYVLLPAVIVFVIVAVLASRKWQQAATHSKPRSS